MTDRSHYEQALAECSDHQGAIALLKQHRLYLEMIPSMRRPSESVITIPLPLIRVRQPAGGNALVPLSCDSAILMCDPEWKIKTGIEIFIFIHRAEEDYSDLLSRWRQVQIQLSQGYEWVMPDRHRHVLSEGSNEARPLFVLFPETPDRIRRGLQGAYLPFITRAIADTIADTAEDEPINDAQNSFSFLASEEGSKPDELA